jgi:hypothetical protein
MRFDYPLELINSKLPKKQPSYYQKCLIGLFIGNIVLLFVLLLAGANNVTTSLVFGSVGAVMFLVFFVLCLAKLYNDESDARDFISVYTPALTASATFNSIYSWLKRCGRWFLVIFSYLLLIIVVLIIGALFYLGYKG